MGHGHSHHHHQHAVHDSGTGRRIGIAFALNLTFTFIEIGGGIWTDSVAVLGDAFHDFGDTISLGVAYWLQRVAMRQSDARYSYGYRRFSLLSALLTGCLLTVASLAVSGSAIPRLFSPVQPHTGGMMVLAVLGIVVNGYAALTMRKGGTLNESIVSLHLLEDVLGWVTVLVGGAAIALFDLPIIDPLLCLLFGTVVLYNVFRNMKRTARLFLQAAPEGIDLPRLQVQVEGLTNVIGCHDAHIWSLDGEAHVLTIHVVANIEDLASAQRLKQDVRALAWAQGKMHVTVEIETPDSTCPDLNTAAAGPAQQAEHAHDGPCTHGPANGKPAKLV